MSEPLILNATLGRPERTNAFPYQLDYIDQVAGDDILATLAAQLEAVSAVLDRITEEASLHRYAADKWSIRQVLNHITDTERIFSFRILWVARALDGALLSFDQQTAADHAEADAVSFAQHREEFRRVRLATLSLLTNLPPAAWSRYGRMQDQRVTVRALAFVIAGHLEHHLSLLRQRYLVR